jgi:hypothetical protein
MGTALDVTTGYTRTTDPHRLTLPVHVVLIANKVFGYTEVLVRPESHARATIPSGG